MHARSLFGPVGGVDVPEGSSAVPTGARNLTTDMKNRGQKRSRMRHRRRRRLTVFARLQAVR